jgi:hypothetical protein
LELELELDCSFSASDVPTRNPLLNYASFAAFVVEDSALSLSLPSVSPPSPLPLCLSLSELKTVRMNCGVDGSRDQGIEDLMD